MSGKSIFYYLIATWYYYSGNNIFIAKHVAFQYRNNPIVKIFSFVGMMMKVNGPKDQKRPSIPPGRIKISRAMISLLKKKSFDAITWAEIAETAGVNEGLIYKYFKDKRNLLHEVLQEYNSDFIKMLHKNLDNAEGTFEKIKAFISSTLHYYQETPVFAKILIIEVRNFPAFFTSETYEMLRQYTNILLVILEEGQKCGDIRSDMSPRYIRQMINGAIEHMCLPKIIFGTKVKTKDYTEEICKFVFNGIETQAKTCAAKRKSAK